VRANDDRALQNAVFSGDIETMKVLLQAGADVHQGGDLALWMAQIRRNAEQLQVVREAIRQQDTRREQQAHELERQRNPLKAGTGLTFVHSRPEDMENLLREKIAEQEQMRHPTRAALCRDHVTLPQP
jgi:hypothetical protein